MVSMVAGLGILSVFLAGWCFSMGLDGISLGYSICAFIAAIMNFVIGWKILAGLLG